jgi:heme oxygenase
MDNLAIAIERGLEILKPHERTTAEGTTITTIPAVVGPLKRQYLELLVDAAMKHEKSLQRVTELETALTAIGYMTPPAASMSRQRINTMAATLQETI